MKKLTLFLFSICVFVVSLHAQYSSDVTIVPILKTDTTSIGQKIVYPSFANDEVTMVKVIIAPGKCTGWHLHHIPVFAYVEQGTLTVEMKDRTVQFAPGSSFAEVMDTPHNGRNLTDKEVVLIAFYMGEKGKPLSVKVDE
jgi:quercetin dioxygenase-like cupin family protein